MTYDYSTQTMYAIGYDESVYTTLLLKVNLTTGETTIAGEIGESKYVALACSYEGQLYAIDVDYGVSINLRGQPQTSAIPVNG